jgi:hypothetical protein
MDKTHMIVVILVTVFLNLVIKHYQDNKAILNDNLVRVCDEGTTNCYMVHTDELNRVVEE